MSKYLERIIDTFREDMSLGGGGGAMYRGSEKSNSGSPTAGYDPVLEFDGRKKKYKTLSKFYQDSIKQLKHGRKHGERTKSKS
tara:strand:- start:1967 stop:2215 length:249 start_codon:yes stop_codon:yes gene_type:complete